MKTIKFSNMYPKLPDITDRAKLLQCFLIDRDEISPAFLDYDTKYFDVDEYRDKFYPLPKGKLIVLLFLAIEDTVFTTIRRYTPSKYDYYKGCEGKDFKIDMIV